jgi:hypothetical protein
MMSYDDWLNYGWLRRHEPKPNEIRLLLSVIERDIEASADPNLNSDWRFAIAYKAALQCAGTALKAAGFDVAKGTGSHVRTIQSLQLTLGDDGKKIGVLIDYRKKRAEGVYQTVGIASDAEVEQIRALACDLRDELVAWLHDNHPQLMKGPRRTSASRRRNDQALCFPTIFFSNHISP